MQRAHSDFLGFKNNRSPYPPLSRPSFDYHFAIRTFLFGIATFLLTAFTLVDVSHAAAMSISGQPNVGASGAFTYSIPVATPPGTAGMAPMLSLDYSSQAGDGFEGLGWALDGLASITRCPRTLTLDTVHGGVNYDLNDRFCLNGQRLMLASGTYGADASTYNTYIDGFSEVVAHGTAGNGPSWFEVHTKTGTVLQLGDTTDSKIQAVGKTTIRMWMVNKITDTKGNYLTVTYTNDQTNGQAYPTRIDYTGNAGASLSTYNSVQFTYATRSDITPGYQAGSLQQLTQLLTDIKTYNGATLVSDYQLAYRTGSSTLHSRLTSVTLCDGSSNCLAPTTFGWQGGTGLPTMSSASNSTSQGYTLLSGDFNADGLTDAVSLQTTSTTSCPTGGVIFSGSSAGTFSAANMTATYDFYLTGSTVHHYSGSDACFLGLAASTTPVVGDFNGDGFADVMTTQKYNDPITGAPEPYTNLVMNNKSGALIQVTTDADLTPKWVVGDFNGDGRADGFYQWTGSGPTGYAMFSNGDGTFTPDGGHTSLATGTLMPGDFDGDGCTDMLTQGTTNAIVYMCNPAVSSATISSFSGSTIIPGDFNGDGKTDLLVVSSTAANLYLSTGTGRSSAYSISSSSTWHSYTIVTGDWNGDGKTDIALISQVSGTPHLIFLSTGAGFTQVTTISNSDTAPGAVVADWNNDGADDLWLKRSSGDGLYTFAFVPELMTSVSNGLGASLTVTYDRLNKNGTFYVKGSGATYPNSDLEGAYYTVSALGSSNGIGATYTTNSAYAGAKIDDTAPPSGLPRSDILSRGLLSFSSITATDAQTGLVSTTNFRTDLPYAGLVSSQTVKSGSTTLNSVTNTYSSSGMGGGSNAVTLQQAVVARTDLDGTAFPTVTTSYTYDSYNNPLTITKSITGGSSQTVTNTFTNDTTNWILGQLTATTVENIVGSSDLTRHFSFAHDSSSGLFTQQIAEPSTSSLKLQTDIAYDAYGNKTSVSLSGTGITTRATTATYDSKGEFAASVSDTLSHSTTLAFNAGFGEATSQIDPNSLTASASYDTLGRAILMTNPDGNKTAIAYAYCSGVNGGSASCPTYAAYVITATPENSSGTQNGAASTTYSDALGRAVANDVQGFSGATIRTATQYDANLRVSQTSRPYFVSGGTAKWTAYTYDVLGRVTQTTFPDTSASTFAYHGLSTSTTNAKSQTTTTVKNAQGLVASVTDANSHTTSYIYDAFGDLTSVTDPLGNVITNTFDLRGRKTASSDPDMGSWSYVYDVLSELTSQIDAKSQTTSLAYDLLDRPTQRVEADLTSNWVYDTATTGIGQMTSACTGTSCTTPSSSTYFRALTYDSLGRPSTTTLTIGGTNYTYTTTYNSDGRIDTVTYPSGFVAKYVYTSLGYLSQIKDNGSGTVYWTVNSRDAELHLTQGTAGSGIATTQSFDANTGALLQILAGPSNSVANLSYGWDTVGNLTSRSDTYEGYTEQFCYDSLNRLTNVAMGASCTSSGTKTVGYDAIGDISPKTGVGTYSYPTSGSSSVRPHAVSSIAGTVNGVVNPTFTYDANGNMTAGLGRTITPTSYNMAASVVQGSTSICLSYDSEHNRILQVQTTASCASPGSSASTTTSQRSVLGRDERKVCLR